MSNKCVYIHSFHSPYTYGFGYRGGDMVVNTFQSALENRGFECVIDHNYKLCVKKMIVADYILFSDPRYFNPSNFLSLSSVLKKKYIYFPFYEEPYWLIHALQFLNESLALFSMQVSMRDFDARGSLSSLSSSKDGKGSKNCMFTNSLFNLVTSKQESVEIHKDYPRSLSEAVLLSCGSVQNEKNCYSDEFLKLTGLKRGEYILQVGRLNIRKNQIASLLATRNFNTPLVFVFTEYNPDYLSLIHDIINGYNIQTPIFFVTPLKSIQVTKNIKLIHSDNSKSFLISAYQNAGLHLHPAFYECPGYTYLEAAKLSVPTVASSWSTLREYLTDERGEFAFNEGIEFVRPDDVEGLEQAVKKMFGKKFIRPDLPIFRRTDADVIKDMGVLIDRYMR